jgi:hypothetical protein
MTKITTEIAEKLFWGVAVAYQKCRKCDVKTRMKNLSND